MRVIIEKMAMVCTHRGICRTSFFTKKISCFRKLQDKRHSLYLTGFSKGLCSSVNQSPHICIIGSGPAGFYTAQQLLKGHPSLKVDIYDKLPVPFGLVRFGVAPDHPDVKNVINTFTQTAHNDRCSFLGNISVGKDISVAELKQFYSAIVFTYGAENDKELGIPGEDLNGVLSARSFVGWYNGLPELKDLNPDLNHETAVILGHGNVALDVARILLTPVDILKKTDITDYALEAIAKSQIKRVHTIGRRGPIQVAFTIKELREMTKLPDCRSVLNGADFEHIRNRISELPRPRQRLTELMAKTALDTPTGNGAKRLAEATKEWRLTFQRSPIEILSKDGTNVQGVKLGINSLEGAFGENQKAVSTEKTEELECGMVLRSIGYKGLPLEDSIPFDGRNGVISNVNSRVSKKTGLYCSGWIKRGPTGVILTTMSDAFATGKIILNDIESGAIETLPQHHGKHAVAPILVEKGIQIVDFQDWEKIDKEEIKLGEVKGKPREKVVDTGLMLEIARR